MALAWQAWYTIAVLAVGVFLMARDLMGPDFAMMGILIVLLIPGSSVVSLEDGLAGFSNSGLLTIGGSCPTRLAKWSACIDMWARLVRLRLVLGAQAKAAPVCSALRDGRGHF